MHLCECVHACTRPCESVLGLYPLRVGVGDLNSCGAPGVRAACSWLEVEPILVPGWEAGPYVLH